MLLNFVRALSSTSIVTMAEKKTKVYTDDSSELSNPFYSIPYTSNIVLSVHVPNTSRNEANIRVSKSAISTIIYTRYSFVVHLLALLSGSHISGANSIVP